VGPGQRESTGQIGQGQEQRRLCRCRLHNRLTRHGGRETMGSRRFPRHCLGNRGAPRYERRCRSYWAARRFERQCRSYLVCRRCEIELPEASEVESRKATTKPGGQVVGQPLEHFFAIFGAGLASLLELDDPAPDIPIGRRHERVDGASAGPARGFQQLADAAEQVRIGARRHGSRGALLRDDLLHARGTSLRLRSSVASTMLRQFLPPPRPPRLRVREGVPALSLALRISA